MSSRKDKPIINEQPATYEDYANMPDDGSRYELADGVLELMTPAPTPKHQVISSQLLNILMNSCQNQYIVIASPIDLILSSTEIRQPDIVMVHRSKIAIITTRGIEGTPDLVVEILSTNSVKRDKQNKLIVYAKHHIPEYWIVDPANECLEQYTLTGDKYELLTIFEKEETIQSCLLYTSDAADE